MVVPFLVLKHMCCVCVDVVNQASRASYDAAPQQDIEMRNAPTSPPAAVNRRNSEIPSAPANPDFLVNYHNQEEQFLRLNPTPIQWSILTGPYEALSIQAAIAISKAASLRVRYDTISGTVTDMDFNNLEYVPKPPANIILTYEARLARSPPVGTFTDDEGIIRHKTYMFLSYVPNSNKWINIQTGQHITGLASPREYSTAVRY
jgi:hypothetical protein